MRQHHIKLRRWFAIGLLAVATFAAGAALAQSGGGYDLTWSTIDAGGGTSTGGGYTLSATIGQPDAGASLSGGGYTLDGGFWAGGTSGGVSTTDRELYIPWVYR